MGPTDSSMQTQGASAGGAPRRKKSLLIGINYVGSQHELEGCHQDVHNMREFLQAVRADALLSPCTHADLP